MTPVSVLLVDDQDDMRQMLALVIEAAAIGVVVCGQSASGPQALACIDELDPSVVLIDQMMPDMSGLETAEHVLRRRPAQTIVLFSASANDDLVQRATDAGITACISKDRLIKLPGILRALGKGADDPLDADVLAQLAELGDDLVAELAALFLSSSPGRAEELRAAIMRADRDAAANLAHELKGSSASIGLCQLSLRCAALEGQLRDTGLDGARALLDDLDLEMQRGVLRLQGIVATA